MIENNSLLLFAVPVFSIQSHNRGNAWKYLNFSQVLITPIIFETLKNIEDYHLHSTLYPIIDQESTILHAVIHIFTKNIKNFLKY